MATHCSRFVQNAWKKELCANCFKSKEEHNISTPTKTVVTAVAPKAVKTHSILKSQSNSKKNGKNAKVHFPNEEAQVIGYGGDDVYSSDGEEHVDRGGSSDEEDTEEDRSLIELTRNNTHFNISLSGEPRLLLGQPLKDSTGQKKTLLVSVTPFSDGGKTGPSGPKSVTKSEFTKPVENLSKRSLTSTFNSSAQNGKPDKDEKVEDVTTETEIKESSKNLIEDNEKTDMKMLIKTEETEIVQKSPATEEPVCNIEKTSETLLSVNNGTNNEQIQENNTGKQESPQEEVKPKFQSTTFSEKMKSFTPNYGLSNKLSYTSKLTEAIQRPLYKKNLTISKLSDTNSVKSSALTIEKSGIFNYRKIDIDDIPSKTETTGTLNGTENSPKIKLPTLSNSHFKSDSNNERKAFLRAELNTSENDNNKNNLVNNPDKIQPSHSNDSSEISKTEQHIYSNTKSDSIKDEATVTLKSSEFNEVSSKYLYENIEVHSEKSDLTLKTLQTSATNYSNIHDILSIHEQSNNLLNALSSRKIEGKPAEELKQDIPVLDGSLEESSEGDSLMFQMEASRELAGEPDGRADPDEPPELPRSPPPEIDPQPSFLHSILQSVNKSNASEKVIKEVSAPLPTKKKTPPIQVPDAIVIPESGRSTPHKRQAPKPPPSDDGQLFPSPGSSPDSNKDDDIQWVSTCNTQLIDSFAQSTSCISSQPDFCPEPITKKGLSLSAESLTNHNPIVEHVVPDKKKSNRPKFSLKKFLRIGSKDELKGGSTNSGSTKDHPTVVRPRPEIIHPLELNGLTVEIAHTHVIKQNGEQSRPTSSNSNSSKDTDLSSDSPSHNTGQNVLPPKVRPNKPPPPPCNHSLETWTKAPDIPEKPVRPPAPRIADVVLQQDQTSAAHNIYANLGEVRSGLVPNKPQRVSSIRDTNTDGPRRKQMVKSQSEDLGYETIDILNGKPLLISQLSREDDSELNSHRQKTSRLRLRKGRSIVHKSLEDNYEAVIVANHDALMQVLEQVNRGCILSPVLRNIKEVVNLQWADFSNLDVEKMIVAGRRVFCPAIWETHSVTLCITADHSLQSSLNAKGNSMLEPLAEFSDYIPAKYLPMLGKDETEQVQAFVAVLARLQVDTLESYSLIMQETPYGSIEERLKDATFALLQLVNGLKALQVQGIEESPKSLSNFVLCRDDQDIQPRLCVLQGLEVGVARTEIDEEKVSLCQCALAAVKLLLPSAPLTSLVSSILAQERAVSLSQVKSVLEFSLWGPSDITLRVAAVDRELALQRWLDLERATVLHGLVKTRIDLTLFEECHLLFLVRTNAKMMHEASCLLENHLGSESTSV